MFLSILAFSGGMRLRADQWARRNTLAPLENPRAAGDDHPVWENIEQLCRCGLITFVPHLWESDSGEAEVIHAYGIKGVGGEQIEIELGEAANQAGLRLALEFKAQQARIEGYCWTAPIKNTLPEAQLIGVGRLTYRPHTRRTSEWFAQLKRERPALDAGLPRNG